MFNIWKKSQKILGMNARNLQYVRPLNLKKARGIADDKILSKHVLKKAGVPVPELIATINTHDELKDFNWEKLPNSFVIKPNRGFGGAGIIVLFGRKKGVTNAWVKADGSIVTAQDIHTHVHNIIEGMFSLSGVSDTALFEERLTLLKLFRPYAYRGIPDLRIIVYNKVPVMAMLRLPTKESGGKANLQQGGVGVGIDMATGTTTTAVQGKGKIIEHAPDTHMLLAGIKIPYWDNILMMAVKAQEASGLGFLGADVVIDRDRGPVFLELNARPGLSIQVANMAGLKERLERVAGLKIKTAKRGVRMGKDLFGGEIEESLEQKSGKRVIGSIESVRFIGKDDKEVTVKAKIDTGAYSTSIDCGLARELGFGATIDAFEQIDSDEIEEIVAKGSGADKIIMKKYGSSVPNLVEISVTRSSSGLTIRPMVKIVFVMDDVRIVTRMNIIDRERMTYLSIIGNRDLSQFLIDVTK